MIAVLEQAIACANAGDDLRLAALYTDQALYAQGPTIETSIQEQTNVDATPAHRAITSASASTPRSHPGITHVLLFATTTGWRIDTQFDRVVPPGATEPVYEAGSLEVWPRTDDRFQAPKS